MKNTLYNKIAEIVSFYVKLEDKVISKKEYHLFILELVNELKTLHKEQYILDNLNDIIKKNHKSLIKKG